MLHVKAATSWAMLYIADNPSHYEAEPASRQAPKEAFFRPSGAWETLGWRFPMAYAMGYDVSPFQG